MEVSAAKNQVSYRFPSSLDWRSGVDDWLSADETLRSVHGDGPDGVLSQVLGHLQDEPGLAALHVEGVEDLGEALVELHVNDGADDGQDLALVGGGGGGGGGILLQAWKGKKILTAVCHVA